MTQEDLGVRNEDGEPAANEMFKSLYDFKAESYGMVLSMISDEINKDHENIDFSKLLTDHFNDFKESHFNEAVKKYGRGIVEIAKVYGVIKDILVTAVKADNLFEIVWCLKARKDILLLAKETGYNNDDGETAKVKAEDILGKLHYELAAQWNDRS